MRKQTLAEVILEHGHKAWHLNAHQIGVQCIGERVTILRNDVESVREWLGY